MEMTSARGESSSYDYIKRNLERVRARLAAAALHAGVPVPRLVAVTKSASDDEVRALLALGVDAIAENRPQLFRTRAAIQDEMREADPAVSGEIHLIGHLQANKIKYVLGRAALIQSLDSLRLAEELERAAAARGVTVPVLLEVNSGRESEKGGFLPEEVPAFARELCRLPHIVPKGLMTMGPNLPTPEEYRPYFRLVRKLACELSSDGLLPPVPTLSMGMSDSYEVAAEEGATIVRVGRTLFWKDEQ